MSLPEEFKNQMQILLHDEYEAFEEAMLRSPIVSCKVNKRKLKDIKDLGYEGLETVKWCKSGYYLAERPLFTANPLMHAGVFYVQDASSMIYEEIFERLVPMAMDTVAGNGRLRVLDLCAAPGGKTTSIINSFPDGTCIVANDFTPNRAQILRENLIKWGYPDFVVTNSPTDRFSSLGEMFDIVAVDAPCSGEGMMRKDADAVNQWSPGLVNQCASLQKKILNDAFNALKPGGFLVYSTCTFNTLENESNVRLLVDDYGMVPLDLEFPVEWNISPGFDTANPGFRFLPHRNRGEGLFVAVLRKEGNYSNVRGLDENRFFKLIETELKVISLGIPKINMKGKVEIAATESVLESGYDKNMHPYVDLSLIEAQSYLHREALALDKEVPKGYVAVGYKGYPLGLVKNIGARANNLYPASWKIRMNLNGNIG